MTAPTVRDLRRQWKPCKERLSQRSGEHPTNIRFHRACSWLQRAEQIAADDDLDLAILSQWVAFNALYGQWDGAEREPVADILCWRHFLERMLELDESRFVVDVLMEHKPLVMSIFDDEFLSRYFWQEPSCERAGKSKRTKFESRTWYLDGSWRLILEKLMDRIYFLRCQLVHGAATYNSSLNRTAARHCAWMMDHLLRAFLQVWIEHGSGEDWGILCYPPLRSQLEDDSQRGTPTLRNGRT
ncbi:hypothetical protein LOC68_24665 [Blastopirellula sp. JC732]|uniref:Apea-like HEPN domain-containing protein n=1 Tax=Blastopirellula sediminis TaxID=2894196 RepID=A0A9X1SIS9_9BACT|nr:HEPN domain-containing protein [Blastopirellula sediminis]MCC9605098.1 hypothetical protein [Blastopirellula sediminis]MCC9631602.1 hypothetical protein [Blastopirellula sediminis]